MKSDSPYAPESAAWRDLAAASRNISDCNRPLSAATDANQDRYAEFSFESDGLVLDLSRQRIDREILNQLVDLGHQVAVADWRARMFSGDCINNTEGRPALHVALRRPEADALIVDGQNLMPIVEQERQKIRQLSAAVHAGELRGFTGQAIRNVVNIGIGGSDLGIVMAVQALAEDCASNIAVHCVSNIDGVAMSHLLKKLDPETTLFVICSKTFTTLETLTNASLAREWLLGHGGSAAVSAQCIAVSTNDSAMDEFGIAPDLRLSIWDWVGGRFSLWSAIGLSIALAIGPHGFDQFLAGGHALDRHFEAADLDENLPFLLAMVGVWNRNFLGCASHVVLPYDDHLGRFPAYLQQLEMESNGKSVRRNGEPVQCETAPAIWGEPGSNAQHSFMQLLHQGTDLFSADFILPARSRVGQQAAQDLAIANCLAQAWALAGGDPDGDDPDTHKRYPGGRPSTLIMFEKLDPSTLGQLIALYEHKVFVQGIVWDVNSFDQWGVQLGKRLAGRLGPFVTDPTAAPESVAGSLRRLASF